MTEPLDVPDPLRYYGVPPADTSDLAYRSYLEAAAATGMTRQQVDDAVAGVYTALDPQNPGQGKFKLKTYVDQRDALLATKAYIDGTPPTGYGYEEGKGDAFRVRKADRDTVGGPVGLDTIGKVSPSVIGTASAQKLPRAFWTPPSPAPSTVTLPSAERTVLTTTVPGLPDGQPYRPLVFGSVDAAVTGTYGAAPAAPELKVRLGSPYGPVIASGRGLPEDYNWVVEDRFNRTGNGLGGAPYTTVIPFRDLRFDEPKYWNGGTYYDQYPVWCEGGGFISGNNIPGTQVGILQAAQGAFYRHSTPATSDYLTLTFQLGTPPDPPKYVPPTLPGGGLDHSPQYGSFLFERTGKNWYAFTDNPTPVASLRNPMIILAGRATPGFPDNFVGFAITDRAVRFVARTSDYLGQGVDSYRPLVIVDVTGPTPITPAPGDVFTAHFGTADNLRTYVLTRNGEILLTYTDVAGTYPTGSGYRHWGLAARWGWCPMACYDQNKNPPTDPVDISLMSGRVNLRPPGWGRFLAADYAAHAPGAAFDPGCARADIAVQPRLDGTPTVSGASRLYVTAPNNQPAPGRVVIAPTAPSGHRLAVTALPAADTPTPAPTALILAGAPAADPYRYRFWGVGTDTVQADLPLMHPDNQALAVTTDTAGNIYVCELYQGGGTIPGAYGRVLRWDGTSSPVTLPLSGAAAPIYPFAVAVDAAGAVYVVDAVNTRVVKLVGNTQTVLPFTGLNGVYGVAVDTEGSVYATSLNTARIHKLTGPAQTTQTLLAPAVTSPYRIAVDAAKNVYVSTLPGGVSKIEGPSQATRASVPLTGLGGVTALDCDTAGRLYATDGAKVVRHDGTTQTTVTTPAFYSTTGRVAVWRGGAP